jgi:hypothetical protein
VLVMPREGCQALDESIATAISPMWNSRPKREQLRPDDSIAQQKAEGAMCLNVIECRCHTLDEQEMRLGQFGRVQLPGEQSLQCRLRLTHLDSGPRLSVSDRLLGREVPFLAAIFPVFLDALAKTVLGTPSLVLFDRYQAKRRKMRSEVPIND